MPNDMTQPIALEPGQFWRHNDGSPWPKERYAVKILDVKDGWVRYYVNEYGPDERMREIDFRKYYNELVAS